MKNVTRVSNFNHTFQDARNWQIAVSSSASINHASARLWIHAFGNLKTLDLASLTRSHGNETTWSECTDLKNTALGSNKTILPQMQPH